MKIDKCNCQLYNFDENENYEVCLKSECETHIVGCKYARFDIPDGSYILKNRVRIAQTKGDISHGELISYMNTIPLRLEATSLNQPKAEMIATEFNTFLGYKNPWGGVATRKKIVIISGVSCVNHTISRLSSYLKGNISIDEVDIVSLKHSVGCGHVAGELDIKTLQLLIDGHLRNPNCFGAIFVGLGCEDNQYVPPEDLKSKIIHSSVRQEFESEAEEFCLITSKVDIFWKSLPAISREEFDISNLVIALQCGGSDGLSGMSSNPLLGCAVDYFVSKGARAILAETPEVSGCREWFLARTLESERDKLKEIFDFWSKDNPVYEANPAPGNLKGGLLNIFEKSLGAVSKGGCTPIEQVLNYGEPIQRQAGLCFMDSPGYDPCSITGQISSGANLVVFTTGRGSNYDNGLVPVIKISSNKELADKGREYIDLDASDFLDRGKRDATVRSLIRLIIDIASGITTKSESFYLDEIAFVMWQRGSTV